FARRERAPANARAPPPRDPALARVAPRLLESARDRDGRGSRTHEENEMHRTTRWRGGAIAAALGLLLCLGASAARTAAAPPAEAKAAPKPAVIDVNRASAADLQSVPGI